MPQVGICWSFSYSFLGCGGNIPPVSFATLITPQPGKTLRRCSDEKRQRCQTDQHAKTTGRTERRTEKLLGRWASQKQTLGFRVDRDTAEAREKAVAQQARFAGE